MRLRNYFNLRYAKRSKISNIITLSVIGSIVFIAGVFVYGKIVETYAEDFIVSTIEKTVENQSDGRYYFDYDSVNINIWSNKVAMKDLNLRLKLDKNTDSIDEQVFRTHIDNLEIDIYNLWKWWMDDDLTVQKIVLNNPTFIIINPKRALEETDAKETGKLMRNLGKELDILEIQTLQVRHGTLHVYRRNENNSEKLDLTVPNFNLSISDFTWDMDKEKKHFNSEKFYVEVLDQGFMMPDSSAEIKVERLQYSYTDDRLLIKGVSLFPLDKVTHKHTFADLEVNYIEVKGIDIDALTNTKMLKVNEINISQPYIAYDEHWKAMTASRGARRKNFSIIDSLSIGEFNIKSGSASVRIPGKSKSQVDIQSFDFSSNEIFHNFLLDSKPSYAGSYVSVNKVSGQLSDSSYLINLDKMVYEQSNASLSLTGVSAYPTETFKMSGKDYVDLQISDVAVEGIYPNKALNNNWHFNNVKLTNPAITYVGYAKPNADSLETKPKIELPFASDVVGLTNLELNMTMDGNELKLRQVDLALFDLKNPDQGGDDYISNADFSIPQLNYENKKGLSVSATVLRGGLNSKSLKAKSIDIHSPGTSVRAEGLRVMSKKMLKEMASDSILIESLVSDSFVINHEANGNKKNDKLPFVEIDSIYLNKGLASLNIKKKKIDFEIEAWSIQNLMHAEKWGLTDYNMAIPLLNAELGENKSVTVKKISLAHHDKLLSIDTANVSMSSNNAESSFKITDIKLSDIDLNELQSSNIKLGALTIDHVRIDHNIKRAEASKSNDLDLESIWSKSNPNVSLRGFDIKNIDLEIKGGEKEVHFENGKVKFSSVKLSSEPIIHTSGNLLYTKGIDVFIPKLNAQLGNNKLEIDSIALTKDLKLNAVKFTNNFSDSLRVFTQNISLTDLVIDDLLLNKKLTSSSIKIVSPEVFGHFDDKKAKGGEFPLLADVGSIDIENASVDIATRNNRKFKFSPIDISLRDVWIDEFTDFDKTLVPAGAIDLNSNDLKFTTSDGLSEISIRSIRLINDQNELDITDLAVKPLFKKDKYYDKVGHETDYIEAAIPFIRIQGLDYRALLKQRSIMASQVSLLDPKIKVYRDKNLIDPLAVKKHLPVTLLKEYQGQIDVDSLFIRNANIEYSEVPEEGSESGTISFNNLNAAFSNVTNIKSNIDNDPLMLVSANSQIMGEVPISADFRFHLDSDDDQFEVSGNVAPHNITHFNEYTEKGAFLHIVSGSCKGLEFTALANDHVAYGSMYFQYNDFKIALIDKESYKESSIDESIVSFMANTFIVKKKNMSLFKLRKGDIYFERNQSKSIFNYLAKLFSSGVASSIGLKKYKKEMKNLDKELALNN